MPFTIVNQKILVVEGDDDEKFLDALMQALGISGVQIYNTRGKTNIRPGIKALASTPGFNRVISLGIVRDADNNASSSFQSICDALRDAGLPVPAAVLTPVGSRPQVTTMIMPGGTSTGELEDLCLGAVASYPTMTCVQEYFQCLTRQGIAPPQKLSKAKVAAFLASMPELKRVGEAAYAGYWPWTANVFIGLKNFLNLL